MFLVAIICMIAFCVLIFLFLRNFGNMKPIPVMAVAIAVYLLGKTPFFFYLVFPGHCFCCGRQEARPSAMIRICRKRESRCLKAALGRTL